MGLRLSFIGIENVDLPYDAAAAQLGGLHNHIGEFLVPLAWAMAQAHPAHKVSRRLLLERDVLDRALVAGEHTAPELEDSGAAVQKVAFI